ncbi:glycosyltransferase family 39 protein [Halorussus ruber]|uniref:glycosyltransferase family 39 protein n=1 Tax=Halorussus ruber TaxID=1126238 RepID=UPI0010931072|nr:glycosyltransferase family 39 protein [Halorussus ruber]
MTAGLFNEMANQIAANGYALPRTIPGYTADGLPFAYPPLMFYLLAVVREVLGVGPLTASRVLPQVYAVLYLVPFYFLAEEVLDSRRQAGIAAVIGATSPEIFKWHLSSGGVVRGGAYFFALAGLYVGVRLFGAHRRRYALAGAALFGLTLLSHVRYALFFGASYVIFWALVDRGRGGLGLGASVAGGGLLVASPWLVTVASRFGTQPLLDASGTHGGLAAVAPAAARLLMVVPPRTELLSIWHVVFLLGMMLLVARREWFLPAWFVALAFVTHKSQFLFVIVALVCAKVLMEDLVPLVRRKLEFDLPDRAVSLAVVGLLLSYSVGAGALFVTNYPVSQYQSVFDASNRMPSHLSDGDAEAMEWIQTETRPNATFVSVGERTAEWLPLLSDRQLLVGYWGVEWEGAGEWQRQKSLYFSLNVCDDAACLADRMSEANVTPDYLYLHTDGQPAGKIRSVEDSEAFVVVFENDDAIVAEYRPEEV